MLPLADTAKQKGPAAVTKLLIGANLVVFGWEVWLSLQGTRVLERFVGEHALVANTIVHHAFEPEPWLTVLSHMFLHGGVLHVLGNMWFLWIFGGNVEGRLGPFRFLLFYVLTGIAAAATQVAVAPSSSVPMVGASGAISGVLGGFLVLFPTAFVWTLVPWVVPVVPVPALVFLVLWFLLQAYNGLGALLSGTHDDAGVAWWAHAGGFAAGVAMTMWAMGAGWIRRK